MVDLYGRDKVFKVVTYCVTTSKWSISSIFKGKGKLRFMMTDAFRKIYALFRNYNMIKFLNLSKG